MYGVVLHVNLCLYVWYYYFIIHFCLQQDKRFKQLMIDTAFDGIHREFKKTLDRKSE